MANFQKLLDYYDQLERLVSKLPKPLQGPILNELSPVKELFLRQRPPRVVLAGDPGADATALLQALFGAPVEDGARTGDGLWTEIVSPAGARMHLIDGRPPVGSAEVEESLDATPADLILVLHGGESGVAQFDSVQQLLAAGSRESGERPAVVGVLLVDCPVLDAEARRQTLHSALRSEGAIRERLVATVAVCPAVRFRKDGSLDEDNDRRDGVARLAQMMTRELPQRAKLEMARLSRVEPVQIEIANIVVKSVSVICGAIGAQPIPLADFPILTALQGSMVAAVMYISGKPVNMKAGAEFMAALGANVGLGLVLREGSRALLKFLPGWGNAVSGGVAGAGTWAVGRASVAYFIQHQSMDEARRVFRRRKALPAPEEGE